MSLVFAHRGFSAAFPENTMLAFQEAIEAGADGIELDVHLTKDEKIVVIHDETIDRTTNGSGEVRSFTLEELRHFDAAASKKGTFSFEPIPTLQEYFDCEGFASCDKHRIEKWDFPILWVGGKGP